MILYCFVLKYSPDWSDIMKTVMKWQIIWHDCTKDTGLGHIYSDRKLSADVDPLGTHSLDTNRDLCNIGADLPGPGGGRKFVDKK